MTAEQMHAVAERHVAAENVRDVEAALATYQDDCFYESTPLGLRFVGKDAVAMQYARLFGALPDAELTLDGEAYGSEVLVHWGMFRGTLSGSFFGLPPTGRQVAFSFAAVLHFKNGLMEGERLYFDLATFCEQAGLSLAAVQSAAQAVRNSLGQPVAAAAS
jgi:steroid delta-isomerase-like uncharacterized protein